MNFFSVLVVLANAHTSRVCLMSTKGLHTMGNWKCERMKISSRLFVSFAIAFVYVLLTKWELLSHHPIGLSSSVASVSSSLSLSPSLNNQRCISTVVVLFRKCSGCMRQYYPRMKYIRLEPNELRPLSRTINTNSELIRTGLLIQISI